MRLNVKKNCAGDL